MIASRRGGLIDIASTASFQPLAGAPGVRLMPRNLILRLAAATVKQLNQKFNNQSMQ